MHLARRGFTLVELCVVVALVGVFAAAAWPSLSAQLQRSRRADAVTALLRVQIAQENHRAFHGLYASQLASLQGAAGARSREGWYDIELATDGPGRYEARAVARRDGAAAADRACAVLRLRVHDGQADYAPSAPCWNR